MELNPRLWTALAALWGLIAVAAGAFGAHGVQDPQAKSWLQTGAQYQMVHALAVFACLLVARQFGGPAPLAAWLFLAGSALFAGALYGLALGGPRVFGAVAPLGGLLMMAGWAVLAYSALMGSRAR